MLPMMPDIIDCQQYAVDSIGADVICPDAIGGTVTPKSILLERGGLRVCRRPRTLPRPLYAGSLRSSSGRTARGRGFMAY
jgi:hypothetical protein